MESIVNSILNFFSDLCTWLVESILNLLINLFNIIIVAASTLFSFFVGLLPDAIGDFSISVVPVSLQVILAHINWFLPIDIMVSCTLALIGSVILLVSVRPIIKFIQMA